MKILVTGAAGFVGSNLVKTLAARGDTVVGVDNYDDYYDPRIKRENARRLRLMAGVQMVTGDVRDRARMTALLEDQRFDAIAHLAALAGVRNAVANPALYVDVDLNGTQHLMDAARDTGVPHFVMASTSSVYGGATRMPLVETESCDRPLQPYAAAKRAAEILAHSYHHLFDISFTSLRFFTVYGPGNRPDMMIHRLADSIVHGTPVELYDGGENIYRDWTFVADIVDGFVRAIDRPLGYEIINIGCGEPVELCRFVDLLCEAAGARPMVVRAPRPATDAVCTHADITKARRLLGYEPVVSVPKGVRLFWEWYAANRSEQEARRSG